MTDTTPENFDAGMTRTAEDYPKDTTEEEIEKRITASLINKTGCFDARTVSWNRIAKPMIMEFHKLGKAQARKEILKFIEDERDNGNIEGGGFSAALCLLQLINYLENNEDKT